MTEGDDFNPRLGMWCFEHRKRLKAIAYRSIKSSQLGISADWDDLAQEATMVGVTYLKRRRERGIITQAEWPQVSKDAFRYARKSLKNGFLKEVGKAQHAINYAKRILEGSSEGEALTNLVTATRVATPFEIVSAHQTTDEIKRLSSSSPRYADLAVIAEDYINGSGKLGDIAAEAGVDRKSADEWRKMLLKRLSPKPGEK